MREAGPLVVGSERLDPAHHRLPWHGLAIAMLALDRHHCASGLLLQGALHHRQDGLSLSLHLDLLRPLRVAVLRLRATLLDSHPGGLFAGEWHDGREDNTTEPQMATVVVCLSVCLSCLSCLYCMSCLALPCLGLSCIVLSVLSVWLFLSCPRFALPCHVCLPCPVCRFLQCLVLSCPVLF